MSMNSRTLFTGYINVWRSQCSRLQGVGQRPFFRWDCGHESRRGLGCLFLVIFVCFQVEASHSSREVLPNVVRDPKTSTIYRPKSTRIFKPLKNQIATQNVHTLNFLAPELFF